MATCIQLKVVQGRHASILGGLGVLGGLDFSFESLDLSLGLRNGVLFGFDLCS